MIDESIFKVLATTIFTTAVFQMDVDLIFKATLWLVSIGYTIDRWLRFRKNGKEN